MSAITISSQTLVSVPAQISVRVLATGPDAGARAAYAIDKAVAILESLLAADQILQVDGCSVHLTQVQTDLLQVASDPAQLSMGTPAPAPANAQDAPSQWTIRLFSTPGDTTPFAQQPAEGPMAQAIEDARRCLAVPAAVNAAGYVEIADAAGTILFSEISPVGAFTLTIEQEGRPLKHSGWLTLARARQELRDWTVAGACTRVVLTDYSNRSQPRVLMSFPSLAG